MSSDRTPLWLLVAITISASLGMHLFVPGLAAAAAEMAVPAAQMQLSITVYLLTLAVGQLVWGPLSDSTGRRPALIVGLSLFAMGGLAAAAAISLEMLLAARIVQALGAACGMSLGRAIIRDTTDGVETVRQLALLALVVLLSPGLAPMLGGAVAGALGWRALFVLLGALGLFTLWMTLRRLPETCTSRHPLNARHIVVNYWAVARDPRFMGLVIGIGGLTTASFAFLAAAPFILTRQMGLALAEVGMYSGLVMLALALGNGLTGHLVRRTSPGRLALAGVLLALTGAVALLAQVLTGTLELAGLVAAMVTFNCGAGMAAPALIARAYALRPGQAGTAAGLQGCAQMVMATASGGLVNADVDPARSCAITLLGVALFSSSCIALATHLDRRRTGAA